MLTEIYSEYAGFLNLIEKQIPLKFNQRYLYVAVQNTAEDSAQTEQMIEKISDIVKENFAEADTKIGNQVRNLESELRKIAKEQDSKIERLNAEMKKIAVSQDAKIDQILKLL